MKSIQRSEYISRRKNLLKKMEPNSVAIIPASEEKVRSNDTEYLYRQNSDFFYLTGFNEPQSVLVLVRGKESNKSILFCRPKDPLAEIWTGLRLGPEAAIDSLGVDQAFSIEKLTETLTEIISVNSCIYYSLTQHPYFDQQIKSSINTLKSKARRGYTSPKCIMDLDLLIHEMRMIKSDEEISVMSAACDITTKAHQRAMQSCKSGSYEYEMEAEIQHEFIRNGARTPAYNSIVASGDNACILHYCENNRQVQDGELVLIDAGCELNGYAADITRTFPVNGRFSPEQKAVYDIVLQAQLAAIDRLKPQVSWDTPQAIIIKIMTEGLVELGLLSGDIETLIQNKAIQSFYMHGSGHFLGIDVHDVGYLKKDNQWILFEPGMVLTVEPGLYIRPDDTSVDEKWRGIGIRIEDDVLITEEGHRVLSHGLVKRTEDIEALMQRKDHT